MYLKERQTADRPTVPGANAPYRRRSSMERAIGELGALEQAGSNLTGEFGRALRHLGIPGLVVKLLKLSPTFMKMVRTLDRRYIHIWNRAHTRHRQLPDTSAHGVVRSGRFAGRRIIEVKESQTGSTFEPYAPPNRHGWYDLISIKKPEPLRMARGPSA
jgi:hypothetical protein